MASFDSDRLSLDLATAIQEDAYRLIRSEQQSRILSPEGSRRRGGRYNPANAFGALYLGESEALCRAEIRQHLGNDYSPPPSVRFVCARVRVALDRVLDLTDEATLAELGIERADLMRPKGMDNEGYRLPQRIAVAAKEAGFEAIKAPSVTSQGHNLAILLDDPQADRRVELEEFAPANWED